MKYLIISLLGLLSLLAGSPASKAQSLDIYGGYTSFTCTSGGTWKIVVLNSHIFQCDPLGHVFYGKAADVIDDTNCSNDQFGHDCSYYANIKYGSSTVWANQTIGQLVSWGMNSNYIYANSNTFATSSITNKVPFVLQIRPGYYGQTINSQWLISPAVSPLKNVYYALSPIYAAVFGVQPANGVPDFEDPAYIDGLTWALSAGSQPYAAVFASTYHLYAYQMFGEETDQTYGYNGGYDFATTPADHNQTLISVLLATGSPVQTGNTAVSRLGTSGAIYPDHFNHQKLDWTNGLIAAYSNSISALNSDWSTGSYYTTFGTSGKCWQNGTDYSGSMSCGSTGAAPSTSGSGSGPYTVTLSGTVSKFSVAVYDGSTMICGDNGSGVWASASNQTEQCVSGSVNYSTGAVTLTLNMTPGAAPTIEYIQNGWCVSGATGIMDECANYSTSQAWWGTCAGGLDYSNKANCNMATYGGGMSAHLATKLKSFEYTTTYNWLHAEKVAIQTAAPWIEFIPAAQGSWGVVPDCQISQAVGAVGDIYTVVNPNPTQTMLDFIKTCAGDMALEAGQYRYSNPQSELGFQNATATHSGTTVTVTAAAGDAFYINGTSGVDVTNCSDSTYDTSVPVTLSGMQGGTTATYVLSIAPSTSSASGCLVAYDGTSNAPFSTQATLGADFASAMPALVNAKFTADGVYPYTGYDWWQFYPNLGETNGFGLMSQRGNAYDGIEDVTGTVTCVAPANAYMCGGELQNYGNLTSSVVSGNAAVDTAVLAFETSPTPPLMVAPDPAIIAGIFLWGLIVIRKLI